MSERLHVVLIWLLIIINDNPEFRSSRDKREITVVFIFVSLSWRLEAITMCLGGDAKVVWFLLSIVVLLFCIAVFGAS